MVVLQNQLARLSACELDWCVRLQHRSRRPLLRGLFVVVSRLGNGVFWYALMLWLLIGYGWQAVPAVGHMLLSGLLGLLAYKGLKSKTTRLRPYVSHCGIEALVAPLDEYSFPSGHTLHAVGFTTIAVYFFPGLAWLLLPFTVLVALSRPILGLHYPSDVVVGAILGFGIALSVLWFFQSIRN
jgi:undecaprenyl-diphosphatase